MSSSISAAPAISSKRCWIPAVRICRGGPDGESAADTRTLGSRTARTRRYRRSRRRRRQEKPGHVATAIKHLGPQRFVSLRNRGVVPVGK
jgi:hypothetical protein